MAAAVSTARRDIGTSANPIYPVATFTLPDGRQAFVRPDTGTTYVFVADGQVEFLHLLDDYDRAHAGRDLDPQAASSLQT